MRIERRQRLLRRAGAAAVLGALLLSAFSFQLARSTRVSEDRLDVAAGAPRAGAMRVTQVELPELRTPWSAVGLGGGTLWVLDRGGEDGPVVRRFEGRTPGVTAQLPADAAPELLVAGTDGGIWMTDPAGSRVLRVGPDGEVETWPTGAVPSASATFAGERLWFADRAGGRLIGVAADGSLAHRQLTHGAAPDVVAVGPEGSLWFGDADRAMAGSVSPSGAVANWPLGSLDERVVTMGIGPGQALWLLLRSDAGLRLARAETGGRLVGEDVDTSSEQRALAIGPDGSLWFTSGDGTVLHRRSYTGSSEAPLERPVKARAWALSTDGTMWAVDRDRARLVEVHAP